MRFRFDKLVALAMVAVLACTVFICVYPSSTQEEYSVTGNVIGISSYNQPKLDVKAEDMMSHGIALGALFTIETESATFKDAVLLGNYLGIIMFDIFVNVESDGYISIGCVGKLITAEEGSKVKLTHTGTSDRYAKTPLYNKGSTDTRSDYSSDEVFANFYEVTGGNIKDDILYRSFSPLYAPSKQSRSTYVNELADAADIQYEIALSYNDTSVASAVASLDGYCIDLCADGNYVAPGMGYLYFQQKEKTQAVLQSIIDNDGAYLVHCNVGRDRTGFVILLIQALCNCTADEMKECEARAFCNLYHIQVGSQEYETVVDCTYDRNMYLIANPDKIPDIFEIDWNNIDVSSVDTYSAAYSYCTDYLGFTDGEVTALKEKLCA